MSTPTPRPRATVATIPAYVPGRPPAAREGMTTYKLSSNENPFPPLPGVVEAVARAAEQMNRYPDMGCVALYDALATRLDVAPQQLAAGTGSVAVLYHLLQAYCDPGDEVVFAWRSFEAYPIAASVGGAVAVQVPVTADGRHDLDAMATAVGERTKVVLLCTPNNPTGPALTHGEVAGFLDRVPGHVLVVLDEAYREFVRMDDPLDALALTRQRPNVVVMRTFAKAYGLAGLRVGYLVGSVEVATAVRACSLPFGVSSIAQAAAVASLAAEDELLERVEKIVAERSRVTAALAEQGWQLPEAQGNFVWFPVGDRALELAAAAEEAGIVVRPFAGDGVRVSIGEPEANDRLVEVAGRSVN
ncbi:histidinol-phosphate transaminase [Nocardioides pocheonensis]|uniref:Aromatic amino acid aminotransferase n=1 Tax=Nocardioides pocheonensis TaxID=661485 RepID=A0A3N0GIU5_9ACTN|nr:histidinol-phosphate transaminase [Nocardioides pocheonensis]RNM12394.1 histidinol-phosphate transaminase [Nocardioides pocheonensis]